MSQKGLFQPTNTGPDKLPAVGDGFAARRGVPGEMVFVSTQVLALADAAYTLTINDLMNQIAVIAASTARTLTTPTEAQVDAALTAWGWGAADGASNTQGDGFDYIIINTGGGVVTLAPGAGFSTVGGLTIGANSQGTFRFNRTSTSGWTIYRIA